MKRRAKHPDSLVAGMKGSWPGQEGKCCGGGWRRGEVKNKRQHKNLSCLNNSPLRSERKQSKLPHRGKDSREVIGIEEGDKKVCKKQEARKKSGV
jgi:hypothetical protein